MPYGYGEKILEGITLRDFILKVYDTFASEFLLKEGIIKSKDCRFEINNDNYIKRLEDRLHDLESRPIEELIDEMIQQVDKDMAESLSDLSPVAAKRKDKYENMLEQIVKWKPASELGKYLKEQIREQVGQSLSVDVYGGYNYHIPMTREKARARLEKEINELRQCIPEKKEKQRQDRIDYQFVENYKKEFLETLEKELS